MRGTEPDTSVYARTRERLHKDIMGIINLTTILSCICLPAGFA